MIDAKVGVMLSAPTSPLQRNLPKIITVLNVTKIQILHINCIIKLQVMHGQASAKFPDKFESAQIYKAYILLPIHAADLCVCYVKQIDAFRNLWKIG